MHQRGEPLVGGRVVAVIEVEAVERGLELRYIGGGLRAFSFVGGAATDRLGPARTMWAGWLVYAALALGMARAGTALAAWGLFLALGLVAGLTESPERALVARLAGTHQGSGFGRYYGITGFAALVGGVALGVLFQRYGASLAFVASAAAGAALVVAWPLVWGRVSLVP